MDNILTTFYLLIIPAEITLLDGATCVYRNVSDVYLYVIGDVMENELILWASSLLSFYVTVYRILMECDSTALVGRVGTRTEDIPLGEQTVAQAIQSAKEQIKLSLMK
ncbi:Coatomer subunit zeta-1 [Paragonimus kellicotti]|nr:Coatomer subunit zeta-1 [Paragonimus kellicotti]